ncbi:MAG TPA: type II toxin-antitoxin system Phd/YefM family antitoxin [Roseiflexaceae bacterium]|jgi:prevent-host-death family protein|nr:type II toxin-antitoxin system Phd/YefM family antitoxin [Roseiflexaceae bacterium]
MKIASIADVKAHLSAYVNASTEELVVITRNGKPAAVLLPVEDDTELELLALAYSRKLQAILAQAREQVRAGQGVTHDTFWNAIDADTAEEGNSDSK